MYANIDDLKSLLSENELIELTDDENTGSINQDVIDKAIEDASSEIDAYLCAKMDVPLSSVPKIIKKLCVDIAIYNLFSRKLKDDISDNVRKRYEDAVSLLKMIANGQISIGTSSVQATSKGYVKAGSAVFTREGLNSF